MQAEHARRLPSRLSNAGGGEEPAGHCGSKSEVVVEPRPPPLLAYVTSARGCVAARCLVPSAIAVTTCCGTLALR
ncbi:hypothetical protein EON66_03375 [archaeon]|nr:MAG: hypothetical protein EON66_03375 [archaeon]